MSVWDRLHDMTKDELLTRGLRSWDGRLMLFPGHMYDQIPEGFEVTTIMGDSMPFERGAVGCDDETRGGLLSYGVVAKGEQ